jgi:hypothetical protein
VTALRAVAVGSEQLFFCSWLYSTQYLLGFAPHLLNRIEIRAIGREKQHFRLAFADALAGFLRFMSSEIVHDNNLTGPQGWRETFFYVSIKHLAIDCTLKNKIFRLVVKSD